MEGIIIVRWFWQGVVGVAKWTAAAIMSAKYRAERLRGLSARRRLPKGLSPEAEALFATAARLRSQSLFIAADVERQLAWRRWPRYCLDEYCRLVAKFLQELDQMPEPVRRDLLERGVSLSVLYRLAPLPGSVLGSPTELRLLRSTRLKLVDAIDRLFRAARHPSHRLALSYRQPA